MSVDDRSVLGVRKVSQGIELVGHAPGRASVHLKTADGEDLRISVSVVAPGTTVYEVVAASS